MTEYVLLDNDIVLKACCFGIAGELVACMQLYGTSPSILKVTGYVLQGRVKKSSQLTDRDAAERTLSELLSLVQTTEPNEEEVRMASEFESEAQMRDVQLDTGESLLLAILLQRGLKLMITGDKRAIYAIEEILGEVMARPRIACFEQAVATIMRTIALDDIRERICRESSVDRAITNCFQCASPTVSSTSVFQGLRSYTVDLRKVASRVLLESDDLSALGF